MRSAHTRAEKLAQFAEWGITPVEQKTRGAPEHVFHCAVCDRLSWLIGPPGAPPNQLGVQWRTMSQDIRSYKEVTDKRTGKKIRISPDANKARNRGYRPGIMDIRVRWLPGHEGWIDLKVKGNGPSKEQRQFAADEESYGAFTAFVWDTEGVDVVVAVLRDWGVPLKARVF